MPFVSQAQRRFMYSQHPEIARRWEQHTPEGSKLPERVAAAHTDREAAGRGTVSHGDRTLDVPKLNVLALKRPIVARPVADFVSQIDRSEGSGFSAERMAQADETKPVLVDQAGKLLDGRHRVAKLIDQGAQHVQCRVVTPLDIQKAELSAEMGLKTDLERAQSKTEILNAAENDLRRLLARVDHAGRYRRAKETGDARLMDSVKRTHARIMQHLSNKWGPDVIADAFYRSKPRRFAKALPKPPAAKFSFPFRMRRHPKTVSLSDNTKAKPATVQSPIQQDYQLLARRYRLVQRYVEAEKVEDFEAVLRDLGRVRQKLDAKYGRAAVNRALGLRDEQKSVGMDHGFPMGRATVLVRFADAKAMRHLLDKISHAPPVQRGQIKPKQVGMTDVSFDVEDNSVLIGMLARFAERFTGAVRWIGRERMEAAASSVECGDVKKFFNVTKEEALRIKRNAEDVKMRMESVLQRLGIHATVEISNAFGDWHAGARANQHTGPAGYWIVVKNLTAEEEDIVRMLLADPGRSNLRRRPTGRGVTPEQRAALKEEKAFFLDINRKLTKTKREEIEAYKAKRDAEEEDKAYLRLKQKLEELRKLGAM